VLEQGEEEEPVRSVKCLGNIHFEKDAWRLPDMQQLGRGLDSTKIIVDRQIYIVTSWQTYPVLPDRITKFKIIEWWAFFISKL
jgi:hypothetical protein